MMHGNMFNKTHVVLACLVCMLEVIKASTCAFGNAACYRETCCGPNQFCNRRVQGPNASKDNPYPQCCSYINGVTTCADVATSSASGNPHFQGFDGTHFDFHGYPAGTFNFITQHDHQLNVLLDDFGIEHQTFISAVGFKYKNQLKVLAASYPYRVGGVYFKADNMSIELNDRPVRHTHDSIVLDKFAIDIKREYEGDVLFLTTPMFDITIAKPGNQLRLTLTVNARGPVAVPVHGVLGQTIAWATSQPSTIVKHVQGDEFSYETSGLFADDCFYNLFAYGNATRW